MVTIKHIAQHLGVAASTVARALKQDPRISASMPALWPKMRGMKRFLAQRRLPSMTMAMCCGKAGEAGFKGENRDGVN
mgnify:CR=1 FL=1